MTASPFGRRFHPVLALVLTIAVTLGVVASTWHVFGHTWDEPEHLAAGMQLLTTGHYDYDIQHPPIARALFATGPYLAGARSQGKPPPDGRPEGIAILYGSGHYDLYLMLARAGALPYLALLVLVTYALARRVLAPGASLAAAAVLAATPTILGHAGLATLDVPAAATCLLAFVACDRWLRTGRFPDALLLGLTVGLAVGTKLSAIPFFGLGAFTMLMLRFVGRPAPASAGMPRRAGGAVIAALVAMAVLTLAYGGRFIYLTDAAHHYNPALGYLFGYKPSTLHDDAYDLAEKIEVPLAFQWIVGGIQALTVHNSVGHFSYLLGEDRAGGWWYFYLVALAVKTPLPLLIGGLGGLGLLARRGIRARDAGQLLLPALFVVLLAFASLYSHINIGVRHVLILYPLLAIGAVVLAEALLARGRTRGGNVARASVATVVVAASWLAFTLVHTWPDYLAYFNETVAEPRAVLIDSDLDWGQDFRRLTQRLAELKVPSVALAYLGTAELAREPLPPYRLLGPDEHATGWIAVTDLARMKAPDHFRWLDAYAPRERIGRTIDLYYLPPAP